MEKLTINQGMIKVAEIERNYRYKSPSVINRKKASITYILEADGTRFDCDEKFDFNKELNELISLSNNIEKIKTAIAYANNTTEIQVLGETTTIQGALNKVKLKRELAFELEELLQNVKVSKERKVDAAATSVYYKVTELNFDREDMEKLIENLNREVIELEVAINKANNETYINID
ncbi:hypothetical protein [Terrisporobacter mayombei]|uniref:Uncharacterized protein n=1 Tax=Terrisporobacter mayombei TaxID=1541 RepID=A0ABY9PY56_9FIRM|nr:hypothetical protein [Terrisporobacter mayombei]MCC3867813.1 hypothetical protein [Terrisporobacter mayombei]WMT79944.1 hypothetical protein TEMA_02150 [Terrisporobacter mayombei]